MRAYTRWAAAVAGLWLLCASASAVTIFPQSSGVKAIFASQGEAYKDSDPTGIAWGLAGSPGANGANYVAGAVIPNTPADPIPSISYGGNAFAGGGYNMNFNDLLGANSFTAAQATLADNVAASPTLTSDFSIAIPVWRLVQAPAAPSYAYNQMNFGSAYYLTSNTGLGANASPALPIYINGSVNTGAGTFAKLDGAVYYTWFPGTINTAGVWVPGGPSTSLGQVTYSWLQSGGGSFATSINSGGSLLATPSGDGILSLSGHFWLAGDPFDVTVSTVPEPTALGFAALGGLALLRRRSSQNPARGRD